MNHTPSPDSSEKKQNKNSFPALVALINEALMEKKAEKIRVFDLTSLTPLADFFIICEGNSDIQVKALADNVLEKIKKQTREMAWRKEGLENKKWVVLDYVNVVVHIFDRETRSFYGLDQMWNDAKITEIHD